MNTNNSSYRNHTPSNSFQDGSRMSSSTPNMWDTISQMNFQGNTHWSQQRQSQPNNPPQHMNGNGQQNYIPSMVPLPNIIQDVLRMSSPVGSSPNDESILIHALHDSVEKGQTFRQALEGLHGVNNHAGNLWKDYYLDHKPRLDTLVSRLSDPTAAKVKKPSPFATGRTALSEVQPERKAGSRQSSSSARSTKRQKISRQIAVPKTEAPKQRSTINSITAHLPDQSLHNLLPPHADIRVPQPPSRSPTPPTRIVPGARGNRYTEEDRDYFFKSISWQLKCKPSLTKAELCENLAQKVPHHTAHSWGSFWHREHDVADKILAAAQRRTDGNDSSSEVSFSKNRQYQEDSESDDDGDADAEFEYDDEENLTDHRRNGRSHGSPFTAADKQKLAEFIASKPNWSSIRSKDRWSEFHSLYPERSNKSWAEFHRKHENEIEKLSKRLQKSMNASPHSQTGSPTWAKRKRQDDEDADTSDDESE